MGLVQPLPILDGKIYFCYLDFMINLPEIDGFNTLMAAVDRFGKLSWLLPCRVGEG